MHSDLRQKLTDILLVKRQSCFFADYGEYDNQTQFLDVIAKHLNNGVDIIELSGNGMSDKLFLDTSKKVRELTKIYDSTFIVRGRGDIAYLTSADCVNLEQESVDIHSVREIVGEKALIGLYITCAESDAKLSVKDGADYAFNIDTKSTPTTPVKITDLEYAKWVSENTHIPVLKFDIKDQNIPQI